MEAGKRGARAIALGFSPWIVFAVSSGLGLRGAGVAVALAGAGALLARQWARGRVKAMEVAGVAFFGAETAATLLLGHAALRAWDVVLLDAALAAMAWTTLALGSPFTLQYAREEWPEALWELPLFRRTNALLTAAWGVIFTVGAAAAATPLWRPGAPVWLFAAVVPNAGVAVGVAVSLVFPRQYARRMVARRLRAEAGPAWPVPVFASSRPVAADRHDVVVVGAGIGGLATAALLARRGLKVLVLDQHYLPGGFCTSWPRQVRRGATRDTYVFDAGVHDVSGLGPHGGVRWLLRRLDLEDAIDWRPVSHEYVWPDLHLRVPRDWRAYRDALAERFPAERDHLRAFFDEMEAVYREMFQDVPRTGGVPFLPRTVDEALAYPADHPHAMRWMDVPFHRMLDRYLADPALKRVLGALTGYLTDRADELTVGAMAPIFSFYFDGGVYPAGGSQVLADTLVAAIVRHGGEVRLRTPVRRILVEGGRAAGVELDDGRVERADAVVSNADVTRTLLELVGASHLPADLVRRVRAARPSASAVMVFLGVDYVPDARPITLAHTPDGDVSIAIPSLVDPSLAPAGHSALALIALAPPDPDGAWDRRAPGYVARKRAAGDALVARAERVLPGLRGHIVYRQDATPATFARYAWTTGGAIYGPALGWRPHPKTPIPGLVLAGAGTFPGAGVEAVAISGMIAADLLYPGEARPVAGAPSVAEPGEALTPAAVS